MYKIALIIVSCFLLHSSIAIGQDAAIKTGKNNIAYFWGEVALEATANDTEAFSPRPTITSRYLGLIFTAVFDAWSRFDEKAIPVYLTDVPRTKPTEWTQANKEKAVSYAAYRTLCEYYFTDTPLFKEKMKELGYDPYDQTLDPNTPQGIGNLAALTIIEARRNDGSNQYGTKSGSSGMAYHDYSNYKPVNDVLQVKDLQRWQPKVFADGEGGTFVPKCLTPYWQEVQPLLIASADRFRPVPPPAVGSQQLKDEVAQVIEMQANLTDEQIALVEFMRDGPASVQQAGHWLLFAQRVSVRDQNTIDQDVQMYFLNQATAMDAFVAGWDAKMHYDFGRPIAFVREMYRGKKIMGWAGPGKGVVEMNGEDWIPYSPDIFPCPPFPAYISGHSCVSGACAEALKLFTGSDEFGTQDDLVAKAMTEPDHLGSTVTLRFPTFTEAAEMAGISRVLGGYHIQADNVAGLKLGRDIAKHNYKKFLYHTGQITLGGTR